MEFIILPMDVLLNKRKLQEGGPVQKYIDSEVLRYSSPYVPLRTGAAEGSGIRHTRIGSGEVRYKTPYIRKIYYDRNMNFQGAPQRGAYWFERMKADHRDDILRGAIKISGGKVGK